MVRSRTRSPQSCSRISPAWRCREGVACWPGGTAASDADSAIPIPSTSGRSLHPSASAPWSRQSTLLVGKETATSPGYRAAGGAWEGRRPPTRGPSLNSTLSKLTAKFGSKVAAVRSGARPRCSSARRREPAVPGAALGPHVRMAPPAVQPRRVQPGPRAPAPRRVYPSARGHACQRRLSFRQRRDSPTPCAQPEAAPPPGRSARPGGYPDGRPTWSQASERLRGACGTESGQFGDCARISSCCWEEFY